MVTLSAHSTSCRAVYANSAKSRRVGELLSPWMYLRIVCVTGCLLLSLVACSSTQSQLKTPPVPATLSGIHPPAVVGDPALALPSRPSVAKNILTERGDNKSYQLKASGMKNQRGFSVLAYHRVGIDSSPYTVSPATFESQMQYLQQHQFSVISYQQMLDYLNYGAPLPEKAVLLTIDDGHQTSYSEIYPVLTRYRYPAVFFPYSDYIDNGGLSSAMISEMYDSGLVTFHLHTKTHAAMTLQLEEETDAAYQSRIKAELTIPQERIERILGLKPSALAYPYGKVNRRVERLVRDIGITEGFTVNCAINDQHTNRTRLNRCTVLASDSLIDFGHKITKPALALARYANSNASSRLTQDKDQSSAKPEFLGHISDREFAQGVEIEPFAAYFIDPDGDDLVYRVSELPAGLLMDSKTGIIAGVPSANGKMGNIRVIAIDRTGQRSPSNRFSVTIY